MKLTKTEKAIIRAIIMAQVASDAGKRQHLVYLPGAQYAASGKYRTKSFYELRALKMITTSPRCCINYRCELAPDQNGYPSVLIYFDIRVDGARYQVSFHNPSRKASDLMPFVGTGRKTRWTREIGGSTKACQKLARLIAE